MLRKSSATGKKQRHPFPSLLSPTLHARKLRNTFSDPCKASFFWVHPSLVRTKPESQVFACLVVAYENEDMDIQDIRRSRLSEWFSTRSIPEREKSYISQLINRKASFGERAARRLERDYGMGSGYLDFDDSGLEAMDFVAKPGDETLTTACSQATGATGPAFIYPKFPAEVEEVVRILRSVSQEGVDVILSTARAVEKAFAKDVDKGKQAV